MGVTRRISRAVTGAGGAIRVGADRHFAYTSPPPTGRSAAYRRQAHKAKKKHTYRIVFHNQGKLYELYARHVSHGDMYGFVEVGDIIFGERTEMIVDPSEERLKSEFAGVKRTFVPIHAVVRIDEVDKEGANKIHAVGEDGSNVSPFPMPMYTPGGDKGSS